MNIQTKKLRIMYIVWTILSIASTFGILYINYNVSNIHLRLGLIISLSVLQIISIIILTIFLLNKKNPDRVKYIILATTFLSIISSIFLTFLTINNIVGTLGIFISFINDAVAWVLALRYAGYIGKTYKRNKKNT